MIAAVWAIALGALAFDAQEVPGLAVTGVQALSGEAITNYNHADLNGDGAPDLLFDDSVCFQREGRYPAASRASLPETEGAALVQAWGGNLYLWSPLQLLRYHWNGGEWECIAIHELPRPEAEPVSVPAARPGSQRQVFLHDFDGDGTPEAVCVTLRGVHVFAVQDGEYVEAAVLGVLPGMRLADRAPLPLWPREVRRISFPVLEMSCRLVVEGDTVSVITGDVVEADAIRYRRTGYRWDGVNALPDGVEVTKPAGRYLHPCRLNGDSVLDLAGGRWKPSESVVLALPVYETWASLDGGNTLHVRRSPVLPGFRPRCSFVDFFGAGTWDMVTEETGLFEGGLRETVSRVLTLPEVRHAVSVYRQRNGGFEKKPALRATFTIQLEAPAVSQGPMLQQYSAGELVDVTGDFDGDGLHDVLIRDQMERLSVHLLVAGTYTVAPRAVLPVSRTARFSVADVNGDGRSDIVTQTEGSPSVVHFSREEGP